MPEGAIEISKFGKEIREYRFPKIMYDGRKGGWEARKFNLMRLQLQKRKGFVKSLVRMVNHNFGYKFKQQIAFDCKMCCLWKAWSWPKSQWSLMLIMIPKIGDDDDDDIYIMMACVSVFVSRKMITFLKACLSICNVLSSPF